MKNLYTEKLEARLREQLLILKAALAQESDQTKEMLRIYYALSTGHHVSAEDLKRANKLFRGLLKTLGFSTLLILPFSPLTLPAVVMLGKKMGIDVIPESFRAKKKSSAQD